MVEAARVLDMQLPNEVIFLSYVAGIYAVFVYWGYLQEKITTKGYVWTENAPLNKHGCDLLMWWDYSFSLNLCMAAMCAIIGLVIEFLLSFMNKQTNVVKKSNFSVYLKASLTSTFASPIGYMALKYITFPLMILTKSSKPVPVMLIGVTLYRRTFKWYQYVSVLLICGGISLYSAYGSKDSKKIEECMNPGSSENSFLIAAMAYLQQIFEPTLSKLVIGISLVLINLTLDGFTNNEQDKLFDAYKGEIHNVQMVAYVNIWQTIIILCLLGSQYLYYSSFNHETNSEIYLAIDMLSKCPELRSDIFRFCVCAGFGQFLIFGVMENYGSLVWITISITRKLFTILNNIYWFNHKVKPEQWCGIFICFAGMLLETVMKYQKPIDKAAGTSAVEKKNQ